MQSNVNLSPKSEELLAKLKMCKSWEEKEKLHTIIECDEAISAKDFSPFDIAFWEEKKVRDDLFEQGICPDCLAHIQDHSYRDESTGYNTVYESSCRC